jgi:hypothetical protein
VEDVYDQFIHWLYIEVESIFTSNRNCVLSSCPWTWPSDKFERVAAELIGTTGRKEGRKESGKPKEEAGNELEVG